jgi:hypothetical protein
MRTTREIIDQTIRENQFPEYLLYAFAIVFVVTGEALIEAAIYKKSGLSAIAGVVLNGLAWPAYRATREVRLNNMMLRMLEVPLMKTQSDLEASKMLIEVFAGRFKAGNSHAEIVRERGK